MAFAATPPPTLSSASKTPGKFCTYISLQIGANMNFWDYQERAQRTANTNMPQRARLACAALALMEEAGEAAGPIKRHLYHGHELNTEKVIEELGDLLWYIQEMAATIGVTIEDIAYENIAKLQRRYPDGFSEERSINREV